jgi:anti-sigma factor RsiW
VKLPVDSHARYRELISARIDEPLPAAEEVDLERHLEECSRCRSVERDYRAQQTRLAALPTIPAPRDLWARTSAALDTEMARSPRAARRKERQDRLGDRGPSSRLLAISAASSLTLAIVVIATQLNTGVSLVPTTGPQAAVPTPFDIQTQPVFVADFAADGVTVYQTTVGQVCPTPTIECSAADTATHPVMRITGSGGSSGMAVGSGRGRLALLAINDTGQETISVVTLPATATGSGSSAATGSSSPGPGATPGTAPMHRLTASPVPTEVIQQTPNHPEVSPSSTNKPTRAPRTPAPTPKATPAPSGTQSPLPGSQLPSGSSATAALAILDHVRTAGAPAAWSQDGNMLAFSAMPADRSTGPDVYVWRLGESKAQRLTSDHASYFASWAGSRIVISRVMPLPKGKGPATGTFVLDPASRETRQVPVNRMWLPAVDAKDRWAVSWMGSLAVAGSSVTPTHGGLYLVDWRSFDPFVDHKAIVASVATPGPDSVGPGERPTTPPATGTPRSHRPGRGNRPGASPTPVAPTPSIDANGTPSISIAPQAVEPARDETTDPVLDWQVRWADSGPTFGYWIADGQGANWGRLAVMRVLPAAGGIDYGNPLLDPTLAKRSFSLGSDRVAWVAASDEQPAGELRLRTWDVHGYGGLRIHDINVDGGVPAF